MINILELRDKETVNKLIYRIFNYFNGKVNKFNNNATLEIEWGELYNQTAGAISRNPNIIIIYPKVIARYMGSEYWFWYNVIVSIIHELYHTDQDISYYRMTFDKAYISYIENTVELESYLYIANNQVAIERDLAFHDVVSYNEYYNTIKQFECGRMYKRRNYFTHLLNMLKEILYTEDGPAIDLFTRVFNNTYSRILFVFNKSEYLIIKDRLNCCPLDVLNQTMRNYIFNYTLRSIKTSIYPSDDESDLVIEFETDVQNLFIKPINKY